MVKTSNSVVTIGSISVQPGNKATGLLELSRTAEGTPFGVPVVIVNGAVKGPTLTIVCGIHGDEYDGMTAAANAMRKLSPSDMRGSVVLFPVTNMPAFSAGMRISPIDQVNLNSIFPGDPEGSFSKRLAFALFKEIMERSNYLLDLHSGGNTLNVCPYVICHVEGEYGHLSEGLARAYGVSSILRTKTRGDWVAGTLYAEATVRGVPAILPEAGGEGRLKKSSIEIHERGIMNVMRYLKMIAGEVKTPEKLTFLSNVRGLGGGYLRATKSGLLNLSIEAGDVVSRGDKIGEILDVFGELREQIISPKNGMITDLRTLPLVREGDAVAFLLEVEEVIPAAVAVSHQKSRK
jgi:predicted deacylase